jgi:hypothetical protein
MRIPNEVHESGSWRIHEIAAGFKLEDVWALPARGGAEDFDIALHEMIAGDPSELDSAAARALWRFRDRLGKWFKLGTISDPAGGQDLAIPGTSERSLAPRLPEDLRGSAGDLDFGSLPFKPLYRTDDEFAAEISNRTVHGVMHLAWVPQGDGTYQGQMAVYVKPRGLFGKGYMAAIKPFRYAIVYPALMRQIDKKWNRRMQRPAST